MSMDQSHLEQVLQSLTVSQSSHFVHFLALSHVLPQLSPATISVACEVGAGACDAVVKLATPKPTAATIINPAMIRIIIFPYCHGDGFKTLAFRRNL